VSLRPQHPIQFLAALIAAFLLWYALAADRVENISVRNLKAPLTLANIPRDLVVVTSSVPDTVSLQLRGPLTRALDSGNPPEVLLDLSDARPGLNSYLINVRDIELPREVEVVSIDPPAITLELEQQKTRVVPVQPRIEGTPAPGFVLNGYRVVPAQYTVQGPESLVLALEFIDTSVISVEGATGPVEAMIQPILPDPMLRILGIGSTQIIIDIAPVPEPTEAPAQK